MQATSNSPTFGSLGEHRVDARLAGSSSSTSSAAGVPKVYTVPSPSSTSNTSHAPTTTSATSWPAAADAHSSCQPSHIAKLFEKLTELSTEPESYTLHPSTLPLTTSGNTVSIPSGRLIASALACESPTMATVADVAGSTVVLGATTVDSVGTDASDRSGAIGSSTEPLASVASSASTDATDPSVASDVADRLVECERRLAAALEPVERRRR